MCAERGGKKEQRGKKKKTGNEEEKKGTGKSEAELKVRPVTKSICVFKRNRGCGGTLGEKNSGGGGGNKRGEEEGRLCLQRAPHPTYSANMKGGKRSRKGK